MSHVLLHLSLLFPTDRGDRIDVFLVNPVLGGRRGDMPFGPHFGDRRRRFDGQELDGFLDLRFAQVQHPLQCRHG